jgi:hypothetical protein
LLRWHTRQSGDPLDSSVNYSEAWLRNPKVKSLKLIHPGAPDTVWWAPDSPVRQTRVLFGFFCSFLLNPNFNLFICLC